MCVDQAGLRFTILLPQPLECWELQVHDTVVPQLVCSRNKALEGEGGMGWGLPMWLRPGPNDPPPITSP